jgi:hypothetical protein
VNDDRLTDQLALRVMGWKVAPDRFVNSGRSWIPRWRFRPLEELADAFQLLDCAADHYVLKRDGRSFTAEIRTGSRRGTASGELKARTITLAVARALGLEADR